MNNKSEYVGKICPFCKTAITEEDDIAICSLCDMAHHLGCWQENGGCTTFGCTGKMVTEHTVCSSCGTVFEDTAAFCSKCGAARPVMQAPAQEQPAKHFCGKCGTEMNADQRFCPNCGNPAPEPVPAQPVMAVPSVPVMQSQPAPVMNYAPTVEATTPVMNYAPTVEATTSAVNYAPAAAMSTPAMNYTPAVETTTPAYTPGYTPSESKPKKNPKAKIAVFSVIGVIVLAIIIGSGVSSSRAKAVEKWLDTAQDFVDLYYSCGSNLEDVGTDIGEYWSKYINTYGTKVYYNGHYFYDVDDAVGYALSDNSSTVNTIETQWSQLQKYYAQLKSRPSGNSSKVNEVWNEVQDAYDAMEEMYDCIINVSGNYGSYKTEYNRCDTAVANEYKELKAALD